MSTQLETAPVAPVEDEKSEYIQLLEKLRKKEVRLSYSSLKAFGQSPREFINYKLKKRTPKNEGQIFGSLCDCLLTTPEEFDKQIAIVDKLPSTDMQKNFCNDVISGLSPEDAYAANYKSGTVEKTYDALKDYIEAIKAGKDIATPKMKEEAEKIVANLKKSDLVMQYVDSCHTFQNKLTWEKDGWKFIGFTDGEGEGLIVDFKFAGKGSNPDKFEREIINMKYYLQMSLYSGAVDYDGIPECVFIVYDRTMNYSVIKVDYSLIKYGQREFDYLMKKFNHCVSANKWSESFNFFDHSSGVRTVFKPAWAKGFETETEEI